MIAFLAALAASAHCAPVDLAVAPSSMPAAFNAKLVKRTSANFAVAYAKACREGLIKGRALPSKLFLHNAPDANIASIYRTGKVTVLEYSFVSDGRTQVPSADKLHEAIYCRVHGASAKEQEESGRCLPD